MTGIQMRIEHLRQAARDACIGLEHSLVLHQTDELTEPLVQLQQQKPVERDAAESSQSNVERGIHAIRVSRKATMSYLRASLFNSEPSPNQPPAPMPVNVTLLPAAETELILTNPSMTPVQASTTSPLRITTVPPWKPPFFDFGTDAPALAGFERLATMRWRPACRPMGGVADRVPTSSRHSRADCR